MQREDDRDRAIDRALRQSMAPSEALDSTQTGWREPAPSERSESRGHIDGESLAAWTEGQLRPEMAAHVEHHLSDCAQCQQMLAAFARTAPPPTVVEPLWRRWHLQWLVPIATAATVAAIWVAIPRDERARATSPLVDRVSEAPQTRVPAEPVAPQQSQNAVAAPQPSPPPQAKERKQSLSVAVGQSAASGAKREEFERRDAQADRFAQATPQAAQRAPAAQEAAREKESDKPQARQEPVPPAAPAAAAAASAPASVTTTAESSRARSETAADSRVLAARAFTAPAEIRSPTSANRWRIVGGGRQIERTTSGGSQWETASLSAAGVLTAGFSPTPSICWIVGRDGAVYLSTDGLRFLRLMFPESIDLVSVTATDDRHATVMSADGRAFRTEDGGMSWTRP